MDWIERLNSAINYIEESICDTINIEKVAKIVCCSTYHFQRMFAYMANIPLSEYVRRRRMSLAAADLQKVSKKVIDISDKYGYDSPTAFTRAFKSIHGVSPSHARDSRVFEGEMLYFMQKGTSKISATATVTIVENHIKLTEEEIIKILEENQSKLNLSLKQKERWHKKCLCLVQFKDVKEIIPLEFDHQGNMDDWLIVEKIEDVVVGTSIPYNYEKSRF